MKTLLALAAVALASASVATAQPVFRDVEWGMTVTQVTAIEGRDVSTGFADSAFGIPAVIRYGFTGDRLTRIDVDLTRPHSTGTVGMAVAEAADAEIVFAALGVTHGPGRTSYTWRDRADCDYELYRSLSRGCLRWSSVWQSRESAVTQSLDGQSGRILHLLAFRPSPPSAIASERIAPPSAVSLD